MISLEMFLLQLMKVSGIILAFDGYVNLLVHRIRKYRDEASWLSKIFQVGRFLRALLGILLFLGIQQIVYGVMLIPFMIFGYVLVDYMVTAWKKHQK